MDPLSSARLANVTPTRKKKPSLDSHGAPNGGCGSSAGPSSYMVDAAILESLSSEAQLCHCRGPTGPHKTWSEASFAHQTEQKISRKFWSCGVLEGQIYNWCDDVEAGVA